MKADIIKHDVPVIPDGFKKPVGVVQVAMGKLGFLHRKIYNVMLANANAGLKEGQRKFRIQTSVMSEVLEFNSNNIQELYEHSREIQQTEVLTIEFDQARKGRGDKIRSKGGTSLISEFRVFPSTGVMEYAFSDIMAELLGDPDSYIWMTLTQQNKFSSKYELALFENALRYVGVGSTGFKEVSDWRALLGAEDRTYDVFKDLNKKVIKPAVKGVNEKSGIILEPEFEREKRRVARIKFSVKENPQASLLDYKEHERMRRTSAYAGAIKLGLKEVEIFYWIEAKGERYLSEAVAYVDGRKKVKNRTAYLVRALREGFGEKTPEERQKEDEARARAEQLKADREAQERHEAEAKAVQERFAEHKRERGKAIIDGLSPAELVELREASKGALPRTIRTLRDRFEEVGGDVSRLTGSRNDRLVASYIYGEALKRWGEPHDWNVQAYCEREVIPPEVRALIR